MSYSRYRSTQANRNHIFTPTFLVIREVVLIIYASGWEKKNHMGDAKDTGLSSSVKDRVERGESV